MKAYNNYSKSASATHPGGHRTQNNIQRTAPLLPTVNKGKCSWIRKTGQEWHSGVPRRKPQVINNTKAHWPIKQLNDLQDFWEDIMWTDETKGEGFHLIPSGMKLTQHFIPIVKRDGSVMVCAWIGVNEIKRIRFYFPSMDHVIQPIFVLVVRTGIGSLWLTYRLLRMTKSGYLVL